ncbi:helix-turn-helix transcriptional regulator [Streptomyces varsoviensis]|uniref:helix-turn-helix domain-containing protein n=1 Tax=Streptomyces varsoviensis TaxID=67373 RepID=UPI00340216A2
MPNGPAVRRRKLGAELRRQRETAGLTSRQAATAVGWHQSKVSRIETGRSGVKPTDVVRLLDAYEVVDAGRRALLAALCTPDAAGRRGTRHDWWYAYGDLLPVGYRDFISLESAASLARTLETTVVPGLFQTPEYARAVTRAALGDLPDEQVEELVAVRLTRQSVLRGAAPMGVCAVLDEAVLRRSVGGPEVMAGQLRRLVEFGALPHVSLHVLPFTHGGHIGMSGPFVIFSFSPMADLDVVVLDHLTSSIYLERKEDLQAYCTAFETLRARALPHDDSLEFIAAINVGA